MEKQKPISWQTSEEMKKIRKGTKFTSSHCSFCGLMPSLWHSAFLNKHSAPYAQYIFQQPFSLTNTSSLYNYFQYYFFACVCVCVLLRVKKISSTLMGFSERICFFANIIKLFYSVKRPIGRFHRRIKWKEKLKILSSFYPRKNLATDLLILTHFFLQNLLLCFIQWKWSDIFEILPKCFLFGFLLENRESNNFSNWYVVICTFFFAHWKCINWNWFT